MYPIHVPPLRERRADIPLLAGFFLDVYRRRLGLGPVRLTEAARSCLTGGLWAGNVRELDHVLGRAVLRASAHTGRGAPVLVGPEYLQIDPGVPGDVISEPPAALDVSTEPGDKSLNEIVEEAKRTAIRRAVTAHGSNWAAASRSLGMTRGNLHHMARRLGLLP